MFTGILRALIQSQKQSKRALFWVALVCLAGFSGQASALNAAASVYVNMRTGPSTAYAIIRVVPKGSYVEVHNCLESATWCDVTYDKTRGWISGRYLLFTGNGYVSRPIIHIYPYIQLHIFHGRPPIYRKPGHPRHPGYHPPHKPRDPGKRLDKRPKKKPAKRPDKKKLDKTPKKKPAKRPNKKLDKTPKKKPVKRPNIKRVPDKKLDKKPNRKPTRRPHVQHDRSGRFHP